MQEHNDNQQPNNQNPYNQDPYNAQMPYNPNNQQPYNPEADNNWYYNQATPRKYAKKPWSTQKKVGFVLLIILGSALYFGFIYYTNVVQPKTPPPWQVNAQNPINSMSQSAQSQVISDASLTFQKIADAVTVYQSLNGSPDLSALDNPTGTLQVGFVKGSPLFNKLKLTYADLATDPSFDPEDYFIVFVNDGTDGQYNIICMASKGQNGGSTGLGPKAGTLFFNPRFNSTSTSSYNTGY